MFRVRERACNGKLQSGCVIAQNKLDMSNPHASVVTVAYRPGGPRGSSSRSKNGVRPMTLTTRCFEPYDRLLRARLRAWMDRIRKDWGLDSDAVSGRGAAW